MPREDINEVIRDAMMDAASGDPLMAGSYTDRIFTLLRDRLESLREQPRYYHYTCWGSGTVLLRNSWGTEPTHRCRTYNGDFNCGCRNCPWPDGVITGLLLLTDDQVHYNTMLDRVLALLDIPA